MSNLPGDIPSGPVSPGAVGLVARDDGFVYWQGQPVPLPPKEGAALQLLVREWPNVVSKDLFAQQVWMGQLMSDESLARCIAQLRQLAPPQWGLSIHSVYRRGYRLVLAQAPHHPRLQLDAQAAPQQVEALMHARQLVQQRTPVALRRAEALLRALILQAPDYLGAKLAFAECLASSASSGLAMQVERLQEGLVQLQQVQQVAPQAPGLLSEMAHLLDCSWRFEEAAALHAQAMQRPEPEGASYYYLGWHGLATGQAAHAVAALQVARRINPFSLNVAILLARALTCVGQADAGLEQARQAHAQAPESVQAQVYFLAFQAYVQATPALLAQAHGILVGPATWTYAGSSLAYTLARCGAHAEALQLVDAVGPENPGLRVNFIAALLEMGHRDQAMQFAMDAVVQGCGQLPLALHAAENRRLQQHAKFAQLMRLIPRCTEAPAG